MSRFALLALTASLAACASPASVTSPSPSDPSSAAASPASAPVRLASLAPVAQPVLPAALRPDPVDHEAMDHEAMDHEAMDHEAMDHEAMPSVTDRPVPGTEPSGTGPLADALGAYLAVHDALAGDRVDADAARRFADALRQATASGPSDDPHLWHRLEGDVTAAQAAANALSQAETLEDARAAFGLLSAPFSALVHASGGHDGLVRHTCGMTDAPEGGVWLQRGDDARNPYFGTRMLMCSRASAPLLSDR